MSNVYVPGAGLVGVEVGGGETRLKAGETEGWVASSIIPSIPGYNYDFVLLEAITPGNSSIQISILNASEEASEIGFANETISGFKKVNGTYLSVFSIGPNMYPVIRIQVNLVADGTNRPTLQSWALYYVPIDEWRDDFITDDKMSAVGGINVTEGTVELNLSDLGTTHGSSHYDPYPPLVFSRQPNGGDKFNAFYTNSAGTGYDDSVLVTCKGSRDMVFEDLNRDGYLDLIMANWELNDLLVPSQIYWGDSSGKWTQTGATDVKSEWVYRMATGDVDGDGDLDLVFANYNYAGVTDSQLFLNKGLGTFADEPDVVFPTESTYHSAVATGDLNNDGYDDIIFQERLSSGNHASCYFGGPGGPDTTVDIQIPTGNMADYMLVEDIDLDGYLDVVVTQTGQQVFLGGPNGPDTSYDYTFILGSGQNPSGVNAGDINGDGLIDLVFTTANNKVVIFEGISSGWSNSYRHDIQLGYFSEDVEVLDIDKDGYDDIVTAKNQFDIFFGGTTWPTTPDITKTGLSTAREIGVAASSGVGRRSQGYFITGPIDLPDDKNWDVLVLDGQVPSDTSVTMTILDSTKNEVQGYVELDDMVVDLSGLTRDPIYIKVGLRTESNTSTPILDSLMVKWLDKMTWRDQFYGAVKGDRYMGLNVQDGNLRTYAAAWTSPQLVFSSLRNDTGYNHKSQAYVDVGGLDFLSLPPMEFPTRGAAAFDIADVDGNGLLDIVFAIHQTSDTNFAATSPLFLNSATGWRPQADHSFPTTGAADVLLEDLNDDDYIDVVFAQEQDNGDFFINSTLFWGSASGWNDTADVEFVTTGASGVEVADLDGDGDLDLVFACYKGSSTSTDSMVFTQDPDGFDGSTPSLYLPTQGARAVAAGDLDKDAHMDLVFANSRSGGQTEIDSYIYWGNALGGFETSPTNLPTVGAEDVKVTDLDGDNYRDIVFANAVDNSPSRDVSSYVYLNDGSGGFASSPDHMLPATGAVAVAVGDLDGTGWKDLVFACQYNGTGYEIPSAIYLGASSGWSSTPDVEIPTEGASDVMVVQLTKVGIGGYMSKAIVPDPSDEPGAFHTFRYTAALGPSQSGKIQLIDAVTEEVLAETALQSGTNEWTVEGLFRFKEHPSVRVVVIGEGLDQAGSFEIDELWLNWTKRVKLPPIAHDIEFSNSTVLRVKTVRLQINVSDEFDSGNELLVTVEHSPSGANDWSSIMVSPKTYTNGLWTMYITPRVDTTTGLYDFRVLVMDTDRLDSGWVEFTDVLEVMNNLPTSPVIGLIPARPDTTSTLQIEFVRGAQDVESTGLTYRYLWYLDGDLQPLLVMDSIDSSITEKGQNWSVEVRASDGEDEGPAGLAWRVIENAAPRIKNHLVDPVMDEDSVDSDWIDLSTAFEDPDGDPLTWTVESTPQHIGVEIDPTTGKVTLTPETNWNGEENITFRASDGDDTSSQTITVYVTAINDIPRFATVNGKPVGDGPVEITIKQGELLSIDMLVIDPEGDELVFDVNTTLFEVDGSTGSIRWQPENDEVGTLRFGMTVWDVVAPSEKVTLDFIITVENENDPMDDPRITTPTSGSSFEEDILFSLIAICTDPDTIYGQILNFSWSSNMSGHLGYGSSLNIALTDIGTHVITLTVTDGDHQKMTTVNVIITEKADVTPPPPDDNGGTEEPFNYAILLGIVIALVVVGALLFVVKTRKRTEELETADEEEYKREHMERAHVAVKAAADALEAGKDGGEDIVTDVPLPELEEIDIESTSTPQMSLSMEAKKTEAASAQTMALFGAAATAEPAMSEEEQEQLKLDNLKRNYQNAIGRLPYGIPSKELQDWDWVELAGALATGEKRMTPDGRETTEIEGSWYYSDAKDTGSFLKEHGAKKKPEPKKKSAEVTTDKTALLAKLEERFILGEISEETYKKLIDKYNEE